MSPEILAPVILVVFVLSGVLYTQVLAPLMARRKLERVLTTNGWTLVEASAEPGWAEIMALAIGGNTGTTREAAFDERFGPLRVHYEHRERRSGRVLAVYRSDSGRRPRYLGCGVRSTKVDTRSGRVLPSHRQKWTRAVELWSGEALAWGVSEPTLVYSAAAEKVGEAFRTMARAREVDPEQIPGLRSPSADNPTLALREALLQTSTPEKVLANVFVGPRAWVMTVPLGRGAAHLDAVLALSAELSAVVDGSS